MQQGPHRKWQRLAATAVVLALGACGTRTTGGEAQDVAADVGVTDSDLLDVAADVPDVTDVQTPKDVLADAADADTTPDIPYWVAHDTDLSGLGVVTADGFCGNIYMGIQANDPPNDPTCTSTCPAPYPCTCGACPWIAGPPMNIPRIRAKAIWTGEEVQIFGTDTLLDPSVMTFSAERWNPSKDSGFSYIALPFAATYTSYYGTATLGDFVPVWTGTETFVFMRNQQFLFNPKTAKVTMLPLSPVTSGAGPVRVFWIDGTVIVWGTDRPTFGSGNDKAKIVSWRPETGWLDIPQPPQFIGTPGEPECATALDGALYALFYLPKALTPGSGLDATKPVMVRYDVAAKTWEALPQTMAPDMRCDKGRIMFEAFPDGIAFIPSIGPHVTPPGPPVGEIWWKATGKWTQMQPPPITGTGQNQAIWTGKEFLITQVTFVDPIIPKYKFTEWDKPTWPIRYDPYTDEFSYLTSIGYPKYGRTATAYAYTGKELIMMGGANGYDLPTIHNETFRLAYASP